MPVLSVPVNQTSSASLGIEFANPASTPLIWANASTVTGYPGPTTRVRAVEIDMSVVVDLAANFVWMLASNPGTIAPVAGTTSPGDSGTWIGGSGSTAQWGVTNLYGWREPDFGTWVTDYLTFPTGANSADGVQRGGPSLSNTKEFDFRVLSRCADWDNVSGNGNQLCGRSAFGGPNLKRVSGGLNLQSRFQRNDSSQGNLNLTCPWSSLGFTDGQWEWIRVSADTTNGIRWWTGSPGSWTVVRTDSYPANLNFWIADGDGIGNGYLASSLLGGGFGGDIKYYSATNVAGGAPLVESNFQLIDALTDFSWDSGAGSNWTRGGNVTNVGSVQGSTTVRFEPEGGSVRVEDLRLMLKPNAGGTVSVDELRFDAIPSAQRIGLGWMVA